MSINMKVGQAYGIGWTSKVNLPYADITETNWWKYGPYYYVKEGLGTVAEGSFINGTTVNYDGAR